MRLPYIDVFSPIEALLARLQHGKLIKIEFYAASAWNGYRVERILRQYGIPCWGRGMHRDTRSFLVKKRQASWAEYVLGRAGCPLASCYDPKNAEYVAKYEPGDMPLPWTEGGIGATSTIGYLADFLAALLSQKRGPAVKGRRLQ